MFHLCGDSKKREYITENKICQKYEIIRKRVNILIGNHLNFVKLFKTSNNYLIFINTCYIRFERNVERIVFLLRN